MEHSTYIEANRKGLSLGRCSCGARAESFAESNEADEWCVQHERRAKELRLNSGGPRTPALKTLERQYRENAENRVYTPQERTQWATLADEIADRLKNKNDPIEGQMSLFEGENA